MVSKTEKIPLEKRHIMPQKEEVQIILKNIKMKSKLIDQRILKKEEMRKKIEERERRAEKIREQNELIQNEKLNRLKQKQRDKEIQKIEKQFNKIKPKFNNSTHEEIIAKNDEKLSNKINVYSANRRNQLHKIKNDFYNQNEDILLKHKINEEHKLNFNEVKKELNINELEKKNINHIIKNNEERYNDENEFKIIEQDDEFIEIVEGYKKNFDSKEKDYLYEKRNNIISNKINNDYEIANNIIIEKEIKKDKDAIELTNEFKKFKKYNNIQLDIKFNKNKIEYQPKYTIEKIDEKIEELDKIILNNQK